MPRFVVLAHDYPEPHFDFMLEDNGVLLTWRIPEWPPEAQTRIPAVRLPDHRVDYLTYQGPVSQNRGSVIQVDHGSFMWEGRSDQELQVVLKSDLRVAITHVSVDEDGLLAMSAESPS